MRGMGRWNSKGCQTRVKRFKEEWRQKAEISLAAGREVRDIGEGKRKPTKDVTVKNGLIKGQSLLQHNLEQWLEIVKTREHLPESIEKMFDDSNTSKMGSEYASSSIVMSPMSCQNMSCNASPTIGGMRKTQSIDSSYLDLRDYEDAPYPRPLSRAKSDFNLTSSSASLVSSDYSSSLRAKTMASVDGKSNSSYHVRALYSYLSSGEHQLSFHEGDVIVLIGERNKGWQYGENLRNHRVGWFPIAYTEPILDSSESEEQSSGSPERNHWCENSRTHLGIGGSPLSRTPRRPSSSYTLSSHALPPDPPTNHTVARPHSTFTDSPLFSTKELGPKVSSFCPFMFIEMEFYNRLCAHFLM
ncbi:hypothetical protein AVEN_131763-1 [Araneus ventricosus]|uniref:SH3 domain-containing protein n=1 Tax=Araneus ventricosus TaxID=182803 RepID=A0A4Y2KUW8_ARAVE|nr:hypothetical protein AVEN_131763-1 [Araneus ventricosus]